MKPNKLLTTYHITRLNLYFMMARDTPKSKYTSVKYI